MDSGDKITRVRKYKNDRMNHTKLLIKNIGEKYRVRELPLLFKGKVAIRLIPKGAPRVIYKFSRDRRISARRVHLKIIRFKINRLLIYWGPLTKLLRKALLTRDWKEREQ